MKNKKNSEQSDRKRILASKPLDMFFPNEKLPEIIQMMKL